MDDIDAMYGNVLPPVTSNPRPSTLDAGASIPPTQDNKPCYSHLDCLAANETRVADLTARTEFLAETIKMQTAETEALSAAYNDLQKISAEKSEENQQLAQRCGVLESALEAEQHQNSSIKRHAEHLEFQLKDKETMIESLKRLLDQSRAVMNATIYNRHEVRAYKQHMLEHRSE